MNKAGRTVLTKVTLSAIPVRIAIAVAASPWINQAIDRIREAFIWTGEHHVAGGKCLVAWSRVTRPVELGGLGVLDLTTMGYALRPEHPDHVWVALPRK
jgi:hypothetical protein